VVSRNPQRGHLVILPWWGFDRIKYEIVKVGAHEPTTMQDHEIAEGEELMQGGVVGEIVHLFNGLSEYSSKNDRYGIAFPDHADE
jgi:hypothetical protein